MHDFISFQQMLLSMLSHHCSGTSFSKLGQHCPKPQTLS
ncbi:hypothetical protein FH5_00862 [Priestia endophytica]|nr:hypothetical protein FH5_00862 [Priestia endophytica]